MRHLALALVFVALAPLSTARGQVFDLINLDHLNGKIRGKVVDYTQNHGRDRRIFSPILGRPRDLYVYLPPGYDPSIAYPLILFLHGADVDEHDFLDPGDLKKLDSMMASGEMPRAVVACPDGTYSGLNRITSVHSLYVNGLGGRFEDHLIGEVVPFLMANHSIRPEREAHAVLGVSAGGYGAMGLVLKHRDVFGVVATLAGPLNMRYGSINGRYQDDFDPATYRERTQYNGNQVIAQYYLGLLKRRVKTFIEPVYGKEPGVIDRIKRDNPADLLVSTNLQPGELSIYVNYPGDDNYNFDAQDQSFAWLAAQRGVTMTIAEMPGFGHTLKYIEKAELPAYAWIGRVGRGVSLDGPDSEGRVVNRPGHHPIFDRVRPDSGFPRLGPRPGAPGRIASVGLASCFEDNREGSSVIEGAKSGELHRLSYDSFQSRDSRERPRKSDRTSWDTR